MVELTEEERHHLQNLVRKGTACPREVTRGRILLLADRGRRNTLASKTRKSVEY